MNTNTPIDSYRVFLALWNPLSRYIIDEYQDKLGAIKGNEPWAYHNIEDFQSLAYIMFNGKILTNQIDTRYRDTELAQNQRQKRKEFYNSVFDENNMRCLYWFHIDSEIPIGFTKMICDYFVRHRIKHSFIFYYICDQWKKLNDVINSIPYERRVVVNGNIPKHSYCKYIVINDCMERLKLGPHPLIYGIRPFSFDCLHRSLKIVYYEKIGRKFTEQEKEEFGNGPLFISYETLKRVIG